MLDLQFSGGIFEWEFGQALVLVFSIIFGDVRLGKKVGIGGPLVGIQHVSQIRL